MTGTEAKGHPEEEGGVAEAERRTGGDGRGQREAVGPQQSVSHDMYPKRRAEETEGEGRREGDGLGRREAA